MLLVFSSRPQRIDGADDLVAEDEGKLGLGELSGQDVEIGPTDSASCDSHADLAGSRNRHRDARQPERAPDPIEDHGLHGVHTETARRECHFARRV
jgi:hypothetical protein